MTKKSFFAKKPRFEYETIGATSMEPKRIPLPQKATLFLKRGLDGKTPLSCKVGDAVRTGQKIALFANRPEYVISTVTGTIDAISPYVGDFGQNYTAISIAVAAEETVDGAFKERLEEGIEAARDFLGCLPGNLPLNDLCDPKAHVDTLVICGVENDLLATTRQFMLKTNASAMNEGISALKKLTGAHKVVIALPQNLAQDAGGIGGASGVELRVIDTAYPSALPRMIMKNVIGQPVAADKSVEDMGVYFVSAEAVAALGRAVLTRRIPVTKTFTFIDKNLNKALVEARIGTPLSDVFKVFDVNPFDKDRIVVGGPFTGSAIYNEFHPITPDTDAVMIQDGQSIPPVSDTPCINCGECVRICPVSVPVNMLVRFLIAKQYEDGAAIYDLYSCVECGLCSYVCVSQIPIFQYIKLAKYELARVRSMEEAQDA